MNESSIAAGDLRVREHDLLREDAGDPGFGEGVELRVQGLPRGRSAGVPEADVPDWLGAGAHRPGQLGPHRSRFPYGRGWNVQHLGELGHEAEAGGCGIRLPYLSGLARFCGAVFEDPEFG